jgi:hypothetical protein
MLLFIELVFKSLKCHDYHYVTEICQECRLTVSGLLFIVYVSCIWDSWQVSNIMFFTHFFDV